MTTTYRETCAEPALVGRFPIAGGRFEEQEMMPVSHRELRAAAWFWQDILETANLAIGTNVLLAATLDQVAQLYPLEQAAADLNLVVCSAEPTFFDAGRVESILRRFAPAAIIGVSAAMLDGLRAGGHNPAGLLNGMKVWAWPDAYAEVAAMSNVAALRIAEIGPVLAAECTHAKGLHFDAREWSIVPDGESVVVSSHLLRSLEFSGLRVAGTWRVERGLCSCGLAHHRLA